MSVLYYVNLEHDNLNHWQLSNFHLFCKKIEQKKSSS
jgi:hypothetical protein